MLNVEVDSSLYGTPVAVQYQPNNGITNVTVLNFTFIEVGLYEAR